MLNKKGITKSFLLCTFYLLNYFVLDTGGVVRRAWGKVHLMRSGKRTNIEPIVYVEDQHDKDNLEHLGWEMEDLGIDLDGLDNC